MPELFEKTSIKSLHLKNRSIRSATWSGVADRQGFITKRALELYANLSAGGVGLIVTGFQYILPNGMAMPMQLGNYSDDMTDGLKQLAGAVHEHGSKIMGQLVHTGSKANPDLFFEPGEIWAPSDITDPLTGRNAREMTPAEISRVIEAYANAALRCKKANFDGIQLHGAHAYGINQFLSGTFNKRTDEYGGDITERYRFLHDILNAVRQAVGNDYPVFIKLSGNDYFDQGLLPEEALYVAQRLEHDGIDAIEISAGSRASAKEFMSSRLNIVKPEQEGYLSDLAKYFKESLSTPIITVGGIRSLSTITDILTQGKADYVAFCRPLIREPHLIKRWLNGDTKKSTCVSCNGCFETTLEGNGVYCKLDKKAG